MNPCSNGSYEVFKLRSPVVGQPSPCCSFAVVYARPKSPPTLIVLGQAVGDGGTGDGVMLTGTADGAGVALGGTAVLVGGWAVAVGDAGACVVVASATRGAGVVGTGVGVSTTVTITVTGTPVGGGVNWGTQPAPKKAIS